MFMRAKVGQFGDVGARTIGRPLSETRHTSTGIHRMAPLDNGGLSLSVRCVTRVLLRVDWIKSNDAVGCRCDRKSSRELELWGLVGDASVMYERVCVHRG